MPIQPKPWPEKGVVPASELIDPLVKFLKDSYRFKTKKGVPSYRGYATDSEAVELLDLNKGPVDQILLERVLFVAFNLGIKQGKRILKEKIDEQFMLQMAQRELTRLEKLLEKQ